MSDTVSSPNEKERALKLCCVSVDVDGIDHYHAIHGLLPAGTLQSGLCHELAISRILSWADEQGIPLTWFVIGRDTSRSEFVQLLERALAAGHEVANHTLDHRYDLSRLDVASQEYQVTLAEERIEKAFGVRPRGFRAPGYAVSDELLEIVQRRGYAYDSSVFPCVPYYLAKAAVILGQQIVGRSSKSIIDHPRVLLAPTAPYRIGRPYLRRGDGLLEIPVQVTPWARLPFIGTALASGGINLARLLARSLSNLRVVNLELHAIDFLAMGDGLHDLARYQPDLRLPLGRKLDAFSTALSELKQAGYAFATMLEVATRLGEQTRWAP